MELEEERPGARVYGTAYESAREKACASGQRMVREIVREKVRETVQQMAHETVQGKASGALQETSAERAGILRPWVRPAAQAPEESH